jgi:polysaccharide biosynthesis protein PslH
MKILQLTNKFPWPSKDGGAIATLSMTKGFDELGHEVTLLAMNTSKHYVDLKKVPEEIKSLAKIIGVEVETKVTVRGAMTNLAFSRLPYNAQRFVSPAFSEQLELLLRREKYDVIQLEGLYLAPYIPLIRKFSQALVSLRAHNVEYEIWQRVAANEQVSWKKRYMQILARRIKRLEVNTLNKYDVLVPITWRDSRILNELGNNKPVQIIPTGIDASALTPDRQKLEYPSLFHVGALDWAPNQEGLIWFFENVWSYLVQKYPELKFYLAGRNASSWFIKELEKHKVEYLGEIDDAYAFINSKAIMIVPLFSGSGMRIKIIEGMALGKTIVTTSIGTEGIDTTHNKNILVADTRQGFIEEIERVLNDRKLFGSIGSNANQFVRDHYDNKTIMKTLVNFYDHQIKSKKK